MGRWDFYFSCLPRVIWLDSVSDSESHKRNRDPKSIGSFRICDRAVVIQRLSEISNNSNIDGCTCCMVFYEQMVAGLCLQDTYSMVGDCHNRPWRNTACVSNGKFTGNKNRQWQPGEIASNGIKLSFES